MVKEGHKELKMKISNIIIIICGTISLSHLFKHHIILSISENISTLTTFSGSRPSQTHAIFQHNMLHTFGQPVAIHVGCNLLDDVVGSNLKTVKFFVQHFGMLHDVVLVWPRSHNVVALGHAH